MRHADDHCPAYPIPSRLFLPNHSIIRLCHWKPKRLSEHTCKMSLGRRMERYTASCPAFGNNLPCTSIGRRRLGNYLLGRQAKLWKEASRIRRSAGTKGKSGVKFWLDFSLLAAMASQEALKAAETETLLGRRHGAPQGTLKSVSATGAQSGSQLWPVRCHTPKVTFPNGAF